MATKNLRAAIAFAISMASTASAAGTLAPELIVRAYGPLDRIEANGSVSLLGTTFELAPNADAIVDGRHVAQAASALTLLSGSNSPSVAVLSAGAGSPVSRVIIQFNNPYVPGASQVVATGTVRAIDTRIARLWIGKTAVDYAPILSTNPGFVAQLGDVVQVLGTKPTSAAMILAERALVMPPHNASPGGISGSGVAAGGISGSGRVSAGGISGSGVTAGGISGSGRVSAGGISGSGVTAGGISGSGFASSSGISGSGRL